MLRAVSPVNVLSPIRSRKMFSIGLLLSAPLLEHSKTVTMMVETSLLQSGRAARRQGGCRQGWQCFVKLRDHQRGSGWLSSSIQFNIVFDNGQQLLNHADEAQPCASP
jgi:hypothetical protein